MKEGSIVEFGSATFFADPGSRILFLFDLWIRDAGWVKRQDPDPG
jgi:hypothetical protein